MIAGGKIISCAANPVNAALGYCGLSNLTPLCSFALLPYARRTGFKRYLYTNGGRGAAVLYENAVIASPQSEVYVWQTSTGKVLGHFWFDRTLTAGEQTALTSSAMKNYIGGQSAVSPADISTGYGIWSSSGYPFILNINTSLSGSPNKNFIMPGDPAKTYNYEISWENTDPNIYRVTTNTDQTHIYSVAGAKAVLVRGTTPGFSFAAATDKNKIQRSQIGSAKFETMASMFANCFSLTQIYGPADFSGLTGSKSCASMFSSCFNLTSVAFSQWTSSDQIESFSNMFFGCTSFNANLTGLATTNGKYFDSMFRGCSAFNQSVAGFSTANAINMSQMFRQCVPFNQSVSNFNTANVTDMSSMFYLCTNFNQSVSNFDTSNVTNMNSMFAYCQNFNQSVSNFNTSKVTNMGSMFGTCTQFNQSVANFDTSQVTNMASMFDGCTNFNQPVAAFNTANVTDASQMFRSCTSFNQSLAAFDTSKMANMSGMLQNCTSFKQSLATFNLSAATNITGICSTTDINDVGTTTNYDATLVSWAAQNPAAGLSTNFGTAKYSDTGQTARNYLTATKLWTIVDGGHI